MTTTPAPLTPEREAEIRARAHHEHLSAPPWRLDYESCDCGGDYPCGHGTYVAAVITPEPTPWAAGRAKRTGEKPKDYDFHRSDMGDFTRADWELMAHAREDMPALLAALDAERAENERLRGRETDRLRRDWTTMRDRAERADAAIAPVRAAVLAEVEQHLRRLARHIEDGCDFCDGVDWAADQVAKLTATRPDTTTEDTR